MGWFSEVMSREASILVLIKNLQRHGVYCTKDAGKDLEKLVKTDVERFVGACFKDFIRGDFDNYNKFEKLRNLTSSQKKKLKGISLRRYEYRNTSNLKCIFIVCVENNKNVPIILCAFNEDGDKSKGANSYKKNIERAINIAVRVIGGENGN